MRSIYCPKCGYNLTGLTRNVCPECGTPFDPVKLALRNPDRNALVAIFLFGPSLFWLFTLVWSMAASIKGSRETMGTAFFALGTLLLADVPLLAYTSIRLGKSFARVASHRRNDEPLNFAGVSLSIVFPVMLFCAQLALAVVGMVFILVFVPVNLK